MNILSIGEILWDVIGDKKHIGGAPFNVLAHLKKMGHRSNLFSAIGNDSLGKEIQEKLKELGINRKILGKNQFPTSTVSILLEDGHPDYTIHENVAWDYLVYHKNEQDYIKEETFDLVIFGMLAQRNDENAEVIYRIIEDAQCGNIFFDINIRKDYYSKEKIEKSLNLCSMLKLNEDEMILIRSLFFEETIELRTAIEILAKEFGIKLICITRGGDGAWVYSNKTWYKQEAPKVNAVDTIGAGDSFSAAFLHTYLRTQDIQKALKIAVQVGAFIATQPGAVAEYSYEIKEVLGLNT